MSCEVEDARELVAPIFACPACGECRMDELLIEEDDVVTCNSCGRTYTLEYPDAGGN